MLNEEYKLSPKAAERNRTIIRAAIANYEAALGESLYSSLSIFILPPLVFYFYVLKPKLS